MTAPIDKFHAALKAHGYTPKPSRGGWICNCPAHEDTNPSFSFKVGVGGRVVLHCFAGCTAKQIVESIGLTMQDLMPEKLGKPRRGKKGAKPTTTARATHADKEPKVSYASREDAIAAIQQPGWTHVRTWEYFDSAGEVVGAAVRWQTPRGKRIRPFACNGDGWSCTAMPSRRPLLNLPELQKLPPGTRVYVVEGEATADAARRLGLVATTSACGSQAAAMSDWSPLQSMEVVVLPDHDAAGEKYAADAAGLCLRAGADSVRILRLAETWRLPKGGDLVDVLEQDGEDIQGLRERIDELANGAEPEVDEGQSQQAIFTPFPLQHFPEVVREYVQTHAAAAGYDESFIALAILAALAAVIGNARRIRLNSSWQQPSILWIVIVGESGTMKSPAIADALRPLREIQSRLFAEDKVKQQVYQTDLREYNHEIKSSRRSRTADGPPPTPPEKPVCKRLIVEDITIESLAQKLAENPRGLIVVRDELSGWFAFGRYKKGGGKDDVARWLQLFDAGELIVDRKVDGTTYIPKASCSICGGIQPGILSRVIGEEHRENGLLQRFLLTYPPRRAKRWRDTEIDPVVVRAGSMLFEALYQLEMDVDSDGNASPREVPLTPEARAIWASYVDRHGQDQTNYTGEKAAAFSKLEACAARIALVIHVVRTVSEPPGQVSESIDTQSISAGIALADWFRDETLRVYDILRESDEEADLRTVRELIERRGGTVSFRDWQRLRSHRTSADAREELSVLVDAGEAEWYDIPAGVKSGRPSKGVRSHGGQTPF